MDETNIVYFLQQLAFVFERHCDQVFQEQLGIGYSQYKILTSLQSSSRPKQNQIANRLHQTEASISRQVKLMINEGLIISRVNPKNRREHQIMLSIKGENLIEAANKLINQYSKSVLASFDDKQKKLLVGLLKSLKA